MHNSRYSWVPVVVGSLIAVFGPACSQPPRGRATTVAATEDAQLGPGDVFDVRVFGEEKLSGRYQVGPDGTISFPFVGSIPVGGRDANEVASLIRSGLIKGEIMREPHVSVIVAESNSRRISVLGAVAKPGTFPIIPGISLVQAVSNAGGFTPLASKDDTVVTRRVDGKLERYRVAVSEISRGNQEDFPLRPGDLVFVPERIF